MVNISTRYMGLELSSPLIAASSGLTDNVSNLKHFEESGAGAVVLKSLFEEEILLEKKASLARMNAERFLYPESLEFYDDQDDRNQESTMKYLDLVRNARASIGIPVIPSINCVTAQHWTYFPHELELAGADAIELNVFIMPSDLIRTKEENEKVYFDIIREVTSRVKIPVALKTSFYFSDLASTLKKFSGTGIGGLVLFNRFYSPDIDLDTLEITTSSVLSNPSDFTNALRWIAIMYGHVDCDLCASTGVHDGKTMIKMLLAGATTVQVASAFYRKGVKHATVMIDELKSWMEKKGYSSPDEFRGLMSSKDTGNPAAFQRVQFMKYFRGQQPWDNH